MARVSRSPQIQEPASPPASSTEAATPSQGTDIVTYWTALRAARRFPESTDLDSKRIASDWPDSILIRCRRGSRVLQPERVFAGKEAPPTGLAGRNETTRVNLSPMLLQWLLGLAGEVVREGRPMEDSDTFPSLNRVTRYRAVALPFSDDQRTVDHVLCHVTSQA